MTHKTKATPKDRQCGNTKPVQDNRKSAITATCAGEEKVLILTICNQYVGGKAWCPLVAVFVHISAISMTHHAAHNGALFFDGVGLAPTNENTDKTSRRPSMVLLVGERLRSLANLLAGLPIPASDATSTAVKKCLRTYNGLGYVYPAPHKTGAGICSPNMYKATPDAASVFFVVRYTRHSMAWCAHLMAGCSQAPDLATAHRAALIMVTLAGQPQGWPVPLYAGTANPVNVTAPIKICSLGGDFLNLYKEAVYHG
ncbi:ash family protein [Salmonella enterica]|nr:ash family protein [Salmonella enterica]ELE3133259.1 ash family protein [Salmonella enterica]ELF0569068.1 ash family protein [Salmonella enterica]ELO2077273.1 ash family protein [Salmonella enterica]ELO2809306.1 ash family protein [Salmonella enterica]